MIGRRSRSESGFTLLESLVMTVLLAIALATATALVQERVQTARLRIAAQQFAVHLRSARFAAVSQRSATEVVVTTAPVNSYRYTDVRGRVHTIRVPAGVEIKISTSPIRFEPNGTVTGGASTILEAELSGSRRERWRIDTETLGIPRLTHSRIDD